MILRTIRDLVGDPQSGISLLYHDIVQRDVASTSGFVTEGSWRYKLPPELFERHLAAISRSRFEPTIKTEDTPELPIYLTFDDGGATAMEAARRLEAYGYRGHFFIVVDRIGDNRFLDWEQVRALDRRGHVVGSHTLTHPNLAQARPERLRRELTGSKRRIAAEIGSCRSVSIPLGAYNAKVFEAVHETGYEYVFTSEPIRISQENHNRRIGRWNIWHDTTPNELSSILAAAPALILRTIVRWYGVKLAKKILGYDRFVRLRDAMI